MATAPKSFNIDTAAEDFAAPGREIECPVTAPGEAEAVEKFGLHRRRQVKVKVGDWTFSAVWGWGTYSTAARPGGGFPALDSETAPESPDAEIAVWKGDGNFMELHGDSVEGWVSPESFVAALDAAVRDDAEAIRAALVRSED